MKGTPNRATAEREAKVENSGLTPLAYMLAVLRDEDADAEDRKWAAQAAAPYVHPKLSAIEHSGVIEGTEAPEDSEALTAIERRVKAFRAGNVGKGNGVGTVH